MAFVNWAGQSREYLESLGADRVYLVGDRRPMPEVRAWAGAGSHWLESTTGLVCRFGDRGGRVEVLRADAWLGARWDGDAGDAAAAWHATRDLLRRPELFGEGAELLATPSRTGIGLAQRVLPRARAWPEGYPQLEVEGAAFLRSIACQHRNEVLPCPVAGEESSPWRVVEVDARLAYLASCRYMLPIGIREGTCGSLAELSRRRMVGWVQVAATVPDTWEHVGLLPVADADGVTWRFPSTPGERFVTWAHTAELSLAGEHGWTLEPCGPAWLGAAGDPLKPFADRIWRAWQHTAHEPHGGLIRSMLRAIGLQSIGLLHGQRGRVSGHGPAESVPADAESLRLEGDGVAYTTRIDATTPVHPEWSGTTWAACRRRLATFALTVPRHRLVSLRTDAAWLLEGTDLPGDTGALGAWRVKSTRELPAWPTRAIT